MAATAKVLLQEKPHRAIALATATHVLVFKHSSSSSSQLQGNQSSTSLHSVAPTNTGSASGAKVIFELHPAGQFDATEYKTVSYSVHGTLGLISIDRDVFLCVVSGTTKVATVRPGETIQRILSVDFRECFRLSMTDRIALTKSQDCLNSAEHDHILHGDINLHNEWLDEDQDYNHGKREPPTTEHPCVDLKKLLSGGSFYYSVDFDLTNRLQDRSADSVSFDFDSFDRGYLWNSYMIKPLIDFRSRLPDTEKTDLDSTRLLTSAIRGFALTMNIPAPYSPARVSRTGLPSTLTLISRLSCKRAGTRFNARGIDDDGNVANFVETETIFYSPAGIAFSYVQIRGSIPLFWEQSAGILPGQQKIQITRSPQATQPAFDKHFEDLEIKYSSIHIVNLLSKEKQQEIELSNSYRAHVSRSSLNSRSEDAAGEHKFLKETDYDFHAETRGPGGYEAASLIKRHIQDSADGFGYCLVETAEEKAQESQGGQRALQRSIMILQQQGVFRTNCLDCLDRTNLVQTIISQIAVESFLGHRGERITADLVARHGSLWADNGDALSKIYAGTGALKSSFTRSGKMSLAGALADARKSATRMYINNFADKGRQNTMDLLLGRLMGQVPVYLFDPINDYVQAELGRRASEFTSSRDYTIWCGTLNLNGRSDGLHTDLSLWLCPDLDAPHQTPHIVAVGFQEIVELSPQHIMSTEPTQRQNWERAVKRTLNENARAHGSEEYVLLRGGQLVGASLSIFVKVGLLNQIKNVEASLKKTGMSGMAGNKGAVAIRFDIHHTSVCFVTAHLAAGFANYEERNRDYKTISHGLRFARNRAIEDHDTVLWLGDFNYRIGLSSDKVRALAAAGHLERLYENDQLNLQMVAGLTFPHYSEARITFAPTYKYDIGTDTYDTSEKARIPAWCDRVLRKGNNLRQHSYATAPLRFSDHRPVYANFTCTVAVVDQARRDRLSESIYEQRRASVAEHGSLLDGDDDDDLIGYESVEPGLPPASSDAKKWWLEGGVPARSTVRPPSDRHVLNPARPPNPFSPTAAPDWITKPLPMRGDTPPLLPQRKGPAPQMQQSPQPPPPPAPRRNGPAADLQRTMSASTTASNSSTIHRKPAPPVVPKKPDQLSSSSPGLSPQGAPLSPARKALGSGQADFAPPKPPRPQPARNPSSNSGLMDEEDTGSSGLMGGWVPLKPS